MDGRLAEIAETTMGMRECTLGCVVWERGPQWRTPRDVFGTWSGVAFVVAHPVRPSASRSDRNFPIYSSVRRN